MLVTQLWKQLDAGSKSWSSSSKSSGRSSSRSSSRGRSRSSRSSGSSSTRLELVVLGARRMKRLLLLLLLVLAMLLVQAADLPPGTECIPVLTELEPCLPYVQHEHSGEIPTNDCCTVLREVHFKSARCLCRLLNAEQNQPPTPGINLTLALLLPAACHLHVNPSRCPALLGESSVPPSASVEGGSDQSTPAVSSSIRMRNEFLCSWILIVFLNIWLVTTVLLP